MKNDKVVRVSICFADRFLNLCENLCLIFLALRIAGVIDWSIFVVLSPILVALGIPTLIGIIGGILRWAAVYVKKE